MRGFSSGLKLDEELLVKTQNRYFLIEDNVRKFVCSSFYCAGAYLGKVKDRIFFPSFVLLAMMAKGKANKVVVDDRTAWLFICGRDVFKRGILKAEGSKKKGDHALILNRQNECLGFGEIMQNIDELKGSKVAVKNVCDIGDFLRRERGSS